MKIEAKAGNKVKRKTKIGKMLLAYSIVTEFCGVK